MQYCMTTVDWLLMCVAIALGAGFSGLHWQSWMDCGKGERIDTIVVWFVISVMFYGLLGLMLANG